MNAIIEPLALRNGVLVDVTDRVRMAWGLGFGVIEVVEIARRAGLAEGLVVSELDLSGF